MSGLLGKLNVLLGADITQYSSAMDKAAYKAQKTMSGILGSVRGVAPQLAIALGAVGSAASFKKVIDEADQLNKASQKIGVTVESLSVLRHQAQLADIDFENLTRGIGKFSRTAYDASQGVKGSSEAFKELGITVTDANGRLKTNEELLLEVADQFAGMEDGVRKAALAQELFGRSGIDMIPLLNQGREGFKLARQEAERLGIVISGTTARASEEFNDNLTRLSAGLNGITVRAGNEVIPVLAKLTEQMVTAQGETSVFSDVASTLAFIIEKLAIGIRTTSGAIEFLTKGMASFTKIWFQASTFNFTGAIEEHKKAMEELGETYKSTVTDVTELTQAQEKMAESSTTKVVENLERQQKKIKETSNVMKEMGATFTSSAEEAIMSGDKLSKVFTGLLEDIERILLRRLILEPLFNSIFAGFGSMFGGGGAAVASAHGNVFSSGRVMRFAKGGMFSGPTSFPLAGGGTGIAGEAGHEAILPLKRTAGGDLGVKADVGRGVQVNVFAPPGSSVREERKSDGGMDNINIYIDEMVAGNVSRPGSKTSRALKNSFGLTPELTRR